MTMETIFLIVLAAFNVWTIYFYNKLLLEVANDKEKEKKPPIDPMALVGKSLFKVSQLRKKEETEQKQTESMSVSDNDVTLTDFTLHFSCCFTNLLHSHFVPLLNNFTMQEKCY